MGALGVVGIVLAVVGIVLLLIAFFTFRRSSENEVSKDFFISPVFIAGAILLIVGIVIGAVAMRQ